MVTMQNQNTVELGGVVYQVAQINSLRVEEGRSSAFGKALGVAGVLVALNILILGGDQFFVRLAQASIPSLVAVFGIVHSRQKANTHRLFVTISSGEVMALQSNSLAQLGAKAEELRQLIDAR
jgi:Family of unknown function (DUF6232)